MRKIILIQAIIIIALILVGWLFTRKTVEVVDTIDPRDAQIDSLELLEQHYDSLIAQNAKDYQDSIEVVRTETKPQIVVRFRDRFKTDTVWGDTVRVDIGELVQCNICALRLDSCLIGGKLLDSALNASQQAKTVLKSQVKDYKEIDKLWTERYNYKWYQCGHKRRKLKKINKLKSFQQR